MKPNFKIIKATIESQKNSFSGPLARSRIIPQNLSSAFQAGKQIMEVKSTGSNNRLSTYMILYMYPGKKVVWNILGATEDCRGKASLERQSLLKIYDILEILQTVFGICEKSPLKCEVRGFFIGSKCLLAPN